MKQILQSVFNQVRLKYPHHTIEVPAQHCPNCIPLMLVADGGQQSKIVVCVVSRDTPLRQLTEKERLELVRVFEMSSGARTIDIDWLYTWKNEAGEVGWTWGESPPGGVRN